MVYHQLFPVVVVDVGLSAFMSRQLALRLRV